MTGFSLQRLPLFDRLADARRVLIAGAGGGFDVFAGLPLYFALRAQGKEVFLANLTFTYLGATDAARLTPDLVEVTAETTGQDQYFPERRLAEWFASRGETVSVYAFEKVGVARLRRAYEHLVTRLEIDTVILVDGGTDILMRGDEAGLGTPEEDMTSLASASRLPVRGRYVLCIGFGIDAYHGVCHAHFLENVAALTADGGYLGAFSVLPGMTEGRAFLDAVTWAQERTPRRPSIVNGSIAAAVQGHFGDVQFMERTSNNELFINPLMGLYFAFEMDALVRRSLYLPTLESADSIFDVHARIEAFRREVQTRRYQVIPH